MVSLRQPLLALSLPRSPTASHKPARLAQLSLRFLMASHKHPPPSPLLDPLSLRSRMDSRRPLPLAHLLAASSLRSAMASLRLRFLPALWYPRSAMANLRLRSLPALWFLRSAMDSPRHLSPLPLPAPTSPATPPARPSPSSLALLLLATLPVVLVSLPEFSGYSHTCCKHLSMRLICA